LECRRTQGALEEKGPGFEQARYFLLDELKHLADRFLMLALVLDREIEGKAVGEERVIWVEVSAFQIPECSFAGLGQIFQDLFA